MRGFLFDSYRKKLARRYGTLFCCTGPVPMLRYNWVLEKLLLGGALLALLRYRRLVLLFLEFAAHGEVYMKPGKISKVSKCPQKVLAVWWD